MIRHGRALAFAALLTVSIADAQTASAPDAKPAPKPESTTVTVVQPNEVPVPRVLAPCAPEKCLFAQQKVTVIATKSAISLALVDVKDEFEAATGAQLEIARAPGVEHFPTTDMTNRVGKYDASIAGGWWLGDMVAGGHLLPYDKFYDDPRFPKWNIDDVVTDIIRIEAQRKDHAFSNGAVGELPPAVRADEKRLRQVLLNLLNNAVKFTRQGQVGMRVTRLAADAEDARLRFEVEDTGIGIGAEHLERIFRPFEQATDVQRHFGGTGLGLAISRQLVMLMGSDIHVDSHVGVGSRFWFEVDLPLAERGLVAQVSAIEGITGYEGARRKVLVFDDIDANRAPIVEFLGRLGFDMLEADNGDTAVRRVQAAAPDLVLMDSVMPVMGGMEAIRRLRSIERFRDLPIIVVSANASGAERQQSLGAGADASLPKPIDFECLLPEIANLLDLTWTRRDIPAAAWDGDATAPLVAPPPEEMEALLRLARIGHMSSIRAHAEHLATLDARYRPLATRLFKLAQGFQSVAIVDLLSTLQAGSQGEDAESDVSQS